MLRCDMVEGCAENVTHIDQKGYVYCENHGLERRVYQACRKLQGWEIRRLQRGTPLNRY